jgi:predicted Rossmann fold flavoprotein
MDDIYDLIIIGGGPSGMMAACRVAERGKKVLLLEKNKRLGEKLRISGGGRCNITNAEYDTRLLLKKYGKAEPFLYSLFDIFGVADTFRFFEERGLPLVVEANKRAFPSTYNADDVEKVLETSLRKGTVSVRTSSSVTRIIRDGARIDSVCSGASIFRAKEYILATGGTSHKETGSTGDGFTWLQELGHTVVTPTPTLVPIASSSVWVHESAGVTVDDAKVTFFVDMKKQFTIRGRVLFTHFGLSGPLILNSSHKIAELLQTGEVTATINFFPDTDIGTLDTHIVSIFDANKNKELKNVLKDVLVDGLHKGVLHEVKNMVDISKKVHSVTKDERKKLVQLLAGVPLSIEGLMGLDRAIVVDGGVPCDEIDMKTMKSKKINNLYITGDLLHISRPSGGYSLQLCWSTGYVAGDSVGRGEASSL